MSDNNFQISLSLFGYNPSLKLSAVSLAKVMLAVDSTTRRVQSADETNEFQKVLYPWLQETCPKLFKKFTSLLNYTSEVDRNLRFERLTQRLPVENKNNYNKVTLGNGNFRPLLEQAVLHVETLLKEDVSESKEDGVSDLLDKFHTELADFLGELRDLEQPYLDTVKLARDKAGVDIEKVKEMRKDKFKKRQLTRKNVKPRGKSNSKVAVDA